MKKLLTIIMFILSIGITGQENLQNINPKFTKEYWDAFWISHPTANLNDYGVYHFRKTFDLKEKPGKFIVHVSADNRYRLFVNGTPVCFGPARGDLQHWYFETIDIAPFLKQGKNLVAAVVWNCGDMIPVAQFTRRTAFLLQGNSDKENVVNTDKNWKVIKNEAYSALVPDYAALQAYFVVGPGDKVNGKLYPWNWQELNFDDSGWQNTIELEKGRAKGLGTGASWDLIPRDIPFMEETIQRFASIRNGEGQHIGDFLNGKNPLTLPPNSKISLLLDQGYETVGYPELIIAEGEGAEIELTYAEALFDKNGEKKNRNEVEGKTIKGLKDAFIVGKTKNELFRPLWFRTFRYVQLNIKTHNNALKISNIQSIFTAYPFQEKATFKCSDPELSKIWEVGWRTLRLCSNETHYDCPYYEQLQYVGDTRIQCLISSYVSGDDRLTRKAINMFDRSRFYEGLTQSRYPSSDMQIIPPFSLFWTNMVHDYWMNYSDSLYVNSLLFGIEGVFDWYEKHLDPKTGMLGNTPYWNFVDWPDEWPWSPVINSGGVPPGGADGGSSILTLQFAYALNEVSEIFEFYGKNAEAEHFRKLASSISESTIKLCWDENRKLVADTPDKKEFSQHANIMAILANAKLPVKNSEFIDRVSKDKSITQATFYYRFYLMKAMKKAGLADQYVEMLQPWRDMLKIGLTTFAEKPEPTRSDCHAWSASPNYELLATVCGIEPASPGFKTVKIEPHLGNLQWVEAIMPHSNGIIKVKYNKISSGELQAEITLPKGLKGTFYNNGKSVLLTEGKNLIQ
ncbi:MAG: family 78 glycoside hydrolase catalytic domain [Bacteroidales bacterium]